MTAIDPAEAPSRRTDGHGPGCDHDHGAVTAAGAAPDGWTTGTRAGRSRAGAWVTARAWVKPVAVGAAVSAAALYTGLLDPNTSHAFPLCPLKYLSGADCPACGGLRSTHALLHGDIGTALDHNVVFVLAVPLILFAYGRWLWGSLGHELRPIRVPRGTVTAIIIGLLVFAVVRNLPIPGHAFLDSAA